MRTDKEAIRVMAAGLVINHLPLLNSIMVTRLPRRDTVLILGMHRKKTEVHSLYLLLTVELTIHALPGFFGGSRPSSNPPPQQVVYEQAPPPQKKHGMGMGSMLGIGAAGLVGGAVIGELIEHHEDEERFDAYQDGKLLFLFLYVDVLRR